MLVTKGMHVCATMALKLEAIIYLHNEIHVYCNNPCVLQQSMCIATIHVYWSIPFVLQHSTIVLIRSVGRILVLENSGTNEHLPFAVG